MAANKSVLVLPGDGIGPEVMEQVRRVMGWFEAKEAVRFEVDEDLVGGACYDAHGVSITDGCLGWTATEQMLRLAAQRLRG